MNDLFKNLLLILIMGIIGYIIMKSGFPLFLQFIASLCQ